MTREEAERIAEKQSGYPPSIAKEITQGAREGCTCSACYWRRVHIQQLMEGTRENRARTN